MIPCADSEIMKEFEYNAISCKPEAPWIKRWSHGYKFTEEIQDDDKIQLLAEGILSLAYPRCR